MLRYRVDPPTVRAVPHGLLDVAEVVDRDDAHWRTGIEYDTIACNQARLWGTWCTAAGTPTVLPDQVEITIDLVGAAADGTYTLTATATVAEGVRQVTYTYYDEGVPSQTHAVTSAVVEVASAAAPLGGHLVITDVLTGIAIDFNLAQDAESGDLDNPITPLSFIVPVAAVPEGCEAISTVITAAAGTGDGVDIAIAATGQIAGERMVTVAGHRIVLDSGEAAGTIAIPSGVGEGVWPISVRDVASGSLVSGWIYIDAALTGSATLLQATCPVKQIRSKPWQTLFAPAWTVYAEVECQSMAFEDAAASASDVLALAEHKAVESAWWDLAFDRSRSLGSGMSVTEAVAELEHYIAVNYNGLGLIHIPVYLAAWFGLDYTTRGGESAGALLHTLRGTPVVIGSGYPRQADEAGAGVALMATGDVRLYRSGVEVVQTIDRRTNLRSAVAERTLAAADDCLEPAVAYVDVGVERT